MVEIYNLLTAVVFPGVYFEFDTGVKQSKKPGVSLAKIVLINGSGTNNSGSLNDSRIGIKFTLQVSKSILTPEPKINSMIEIGTTKYRIQTITDNRNPGFMPFWSLEVKKVNNLNTI